MSKTCEAIKLLRDFGDPKKWEILGGHYYRCRGKSDAKTNRWPHEIVQEAIVILEAELAEARKKPDTTEAETKSTVMMIEVADATARLLTFARQQKRHWKRLRKGITPEAKIVKGWIETCEFAEDDIVTLSEHALKAPAPKAQAANERGLINNN